MSIWLRKIPGKHKFLNTVVSANPSVRNKSLKTNTDADSIHAIENKSRNRLLNINHHLHRSHYWIDQTHCHKIMRIRLTSSKFPVIHFWKRSGKCNLYLHCHYVLVLRKLARLNHFHLFSLIFVKLQYTFLCLWDTIYKILPTRFPLLLSWKLPQETANEINFYHS